MKRKFKFLAVCASLAILAIPFVFAGCNKTDDTAFGEWETLTAPTCEQAGIQVRAALANPQVTQTREIPATGHDWNGWVTLTAPTCLVAGVETRTCNTCENSDMRAIPALGHSWGDWETVMQADCENGGYQKRVCLHDNKHTQYGEVEAIGHDFGDWVITASPTCTLDGVETRYCRNCNDHTEVRTVEAYGHDWNPYILTKAPTCTENGIKTSVCVNDASHTRTQIIDKLEHTYGEWVVTKPATEDYEGEETRVCIHNPAHTQTRAIPALGCEDLTFTLCGDGTEYKVKSRSNKNISGTVYIPATYNGLPVTQIADNAFLNCKDIENIVFLGNNLKKVGTNAFRLCKGLKSVSFPASVNSISIGTTSIFYNCPALENITVAEGNAVYKAENGCLIERETNTLLTGTVNAIIPDTVTSIAGLAFAGRNIESVNIPASVESIGRFAFHECKALTSVTFENGALTEIGNNAFSLCENLKEIVIPASVEKIGGYAFHIWNAEQTIVVKGFASQEEADAAWGANWRDSCKAVIIYEG